MIASSQMQFSKVSATSDTSGCERSVGAALRASSPLRLHVCPVVAAAARSGYQAGRQAGRSGKFRGLARKRAGHDDGLFRAVSEQLRFLVTHSNLETAAATRQLCR